jgi:hypothetical protein
MDCEQSLQHIIENIVENHSYQDIPTAKNLLRFLLAREVQTELAINCFQLLFSSEIGRDHFISNASKLVPRYKKAILSLLNLWTVDQANNQIIENLWRESYFLDPQSRDELQAKIAMKFKGEYLEELLSRPTNNNFDVMPAQLNNYNSTSGVSTKSKKRNQVKDLVWMIIVLLLFGCLLWRRRIRASEVFTEDKVFSQLSFVEGLNFKDVMAYFNLNTFASEAELKQAFRRKATELHPDKIGGSIELFRELNDRYQLARILIKKR